MFALMFALVSHAVALPAPQVMTLPTVTIVGHAPATQATSKMVCGPFRPIATGGMVRDCEVTR